MKIKKYDGQWKKTKNFLIQLELKLKWIEKPYNWSLIYKRNYIFYSQLGQPFRSVSFTACVRLFYGKWQGVWLSESDFIKHLHVDADNFISFIDDEATRLSKTFLGNKFEYRRNQSRHLFEIKKKWNKLQEKLA